MFYEKLITLRKEKDLSQEQLADILCTSRQAVSKWERGEAYPDITKLKDLAILFNVSIDYLLDYDLSESSLSSIIERINKCIEDSLFDISIDEIKSIVSKNPNNFELLCAVSNYLICFWQSNKDDDIIYLLIDYLKKLTILYKDNDKKDFDIDEIYKITVICYYVLGKYDLAEEIVKNNRINDIDIYNAYVKMALKKYDEVSSIVENSFVSSIINILNTNIVQVRLAIINNKIEEAYDIAKWGLDFVKSVSAKEDSFLDVTYVLTYYKASIEKYLGLDYEKSLLFLKGNLDKVDNKGNEKERIKFYDKKDLLSISAFRNIEDRLSRDTEEAKETKIYDVMLETFRELFNK